MALYCRNTISQLFLMINLKLRIGIPHHRRPVSKRGHGPKGLVNLIMVGTTVPVVRSIRFRVGAVKSQSGDGDHRPYQGSRLNIRNLRRSDAQNW
jgi:hypothetical protein